MCLFPYSLSKPLQEASKRQAASLLKKANDFPSALHIALLLSSPRGSVLTLRPLGGYDFDKPLHRQIRRMQDQLSASS
jgi:hypothetical protein